MENKNKNIKVVAENKKAYFQYHILDRWEAGIVLLGPEVKAIRAGQMNFKDSYIDSKGTELFLIGFHIPANVIFGSYTPDRKRKLLLHKSEINRIISKITEKGLTLIPLRVYFLNQNIKIEIATAKGKTNYDKRRSIQERENKLEMNRKQW